MTKKEIPLLFTSVNRSLVRKGLKTETRRKLKFEDPDQEWHCASSPYGNPQNEQIAYWLKEPVRILSINEGVSTSPLPWVELIYLDDGDNSTEQACEITVEDHRKLRGRNDWRKPTTSMFMLKSFTRTWLSAVRVWPERLGQMTDESCFAEGIQPISKDNGQTIKYGLPDAVGLPGEAMPWQQWQPTPQQAYCWIWESINGVGSWDSDKWVWAIKFDCRS